MTATINLPDIFVENVLGVCGRDGLNWLDELPRMISHFESDWNISVGRNFPGLSYNFVAPAVQDDGQPAVLKLVLPAADNEFHGEAEYLRFRAGRGAVNLIREDHLNRALLLERATPGEDLKIRFAADPDSAVKVGVEVLKQIISEPPAISDSFVLLGDWTKKLEDAERYGFAQRAAGRALETFSRAGAARVGLLHGDFHHTNILSHAAESFLVIDPKGVLGDLKYDIAVFLNNHRGWLRDRKDVRSQLEFAVVTFAKEFGYSTADIRRWAYAQKVLASLWTLMDGGERWREQLASADIWDV